MVICNARPGNDFLNFYCIRQSKKFLILMIQMLESMEFNKCIFAHILQISWLIVMVMIES